MLLPNVSVNVEEYPHPHVSSFGLVQLLHCVIGQQAASNDQEGVNTNEAVPEDSRSNVVQCFSSSHSTGGEHSKVACVTIFPKDVAENDP